MTGPQVTVHFTEAELNLTLDALKFAWEEAADEGWARDVKAVASKLCRAEGQWRRRMAQPEPFPAVTP